MEKVSCGTVVLLTYTKEKMGIKRSLLSMRDNGTDSAFCLCFSCGGRRVRESHASFYNTAAVGHS